MTSFGESKEWSPRPTSYSQQMVAEVFYVYAGVDRKLIGDVINDPTAPESGVWASRICEILAINPNLGEDDIEIEEMLAEVVDSGLITDIYNVEQLLTFMKEIQTVVAQRRAQDGRDTPKHAEARARLQRILNQSPFYFDTGDAPQVEE